VILHPGVLALLLGSALVSALVAVAAAHGVRVLRRWDLSSGSSEQLGLERRTYLVSTLVGHVLVFQIVSLFLYVYTADALAPLLTGAMCAAGTLRASAWGYPVLFLKLGTFLGAGAWLVLDHADRQGYDYPLIRRKYALLLALAPLVWAEAALQARFFLALRPEVITSCCGSLFSQTGRGLGADLAAFPRAPAATVFLVALAAAILSGLVFQALGRGARLFALLSTAVLPIALVAIVSFISPALYELPAHHCPFCILQREYGHVGYALYATLLGGALAGLGVGTIAPYRRIESLAVAVPRMQRRLATASMLLYAVFTMVVTWRMNASALRF
jgi:hypothetical protein